MNMRRNILSAWINHALHGNPADKLMRESMLSIWKNRVIL